MRANRAMPLGLTLAVTLVNFIIDYETFDYETFGFIVNNYVA